MAHLGRWRAQSRRTHRVHNASHELLDILQLGIYFFSSFENVTFAKSIMHIRSAIVTIQIFCFVLPPKKSEKFLEVRKLLSRYFDSVDSSLSAYQEGVDLLQSYHECKASSSFPNLLKAYNKARNAREQAVALLQSTFREVAYHSLSLVTATSESEMFSLDCKQRLNRLKPFIGVDDALRFLMKRHKINGVAPNRQYVQVFIQNHFLSAIGHVTDSHSKVNFIMAPFANAR